MSFVTTPHGVRLAYVDSGGPGRPILALHGAFGRGRTFMPLAEHLGRRVIALDQRGHGLSDKPGDYSREGFLADTAAFIEALDLAPVTIAGHSLGALNAYQLAARRPELVESFVAIDFPAEAGTSTDPWLDELPDRFGSLTQLEQAIRRLVGTDVPGHFTESAFEDERGWGFLWNTEDIRATKRGLAGSWWDDWTSSSQPALLVVGGDSRVAGHAPEMIARRPHTRLVTVPGAGHDLYLSHTPALASALSAFLAAPVP